MATKIWTAGTGTWNNGQNWSPLGNPGSADDAFIAGPATVTGSGSSNSITVTGSSVSLSGIFFTGTLNVGTASLAASMTLSSGSLQAGAASLIYGPMVVLGTGTKLTVTGQLTLGGTRTGTSFTANTLAVGNGGTAQLGSVLMTATPNNGIYVADGTSRVEVGTAGTAAVGTIQIDAGSTITGEGSLTAPTGIVNNGTILAQGGTLAISGSVTGTGSLQIGAGALLYLETTASSQGITFAGAGGELEVVPTASGGLTQSGTVTGFAPGDSILYAGNSVITSVTYTATGANTGTLKLNSGASTAGSLTLLGNYTGYVFQVSPNANNYGALVSVVAPKSGGSASGGSPGIDAFAWIGSSASWNTLSAWQDTSTHVNAVAVPGSANAVVLNGSTGTPLTITGPGAAASLGVLGNILLSGTFSTGALSVGSTITAGNLSLGPATTLSATSVNVAFGALAGAGTGSKLSVSGTLTLGGSRSANVSATTADSLGLTKGATAQVGSLVMAQSPGGDAATTDATSSLEVGTAGSAAAGTITVDNGGLLQGAGLLVAAGGVINQGTIGAENGMLSIGSGVSGSGQLVIGGNATLSLYNGVSTEPISFAGANGTLQITLTASGGLTATGRVSGFTPGDTILVASSTPITTVSYTAGANGTGSLALIEGAATIGTLPMTGNFTGDWFEVGPNGNYGTAITVVPQYPSPDPLFDSAWYLQKYPSVAASGVDPYQDYMSVGWQQGRDPNPWFHTTYYLNQNPDVAVAGVNPLTHYEQAGWKEGRDPSALFSTNGYLQLNPDVAAAGMDPLLHYVEYGSKEGRPIEAATPHPIGTPNPLINYAYYYAQDPAAATAGIDASVSYDTVGWKLGYNPDPYFDTTFYLTQNADVAASGMDPLTHYEEYGWKEGRLPSLTFDGNTYLAANADVAASGMDPLVHYTEYGVNESRQGVLPGQNVAPDPLVNTAYYDAQLGATLIPTGNAGASEAAWSYATTGWQKGLNPDAFFNTSYYLSHNPDVAAAHIDPLYHYETYGWHEGRNPSAQFDTNAYINANPDVKAAGLDPLLHYLTYGESEGRAIYPAPS